MKLELLACPHCGGQLKRPVDGYAECTFCGYFTRVTETRERPVPVSPSAASIYFTETYAATQVFVRYRDEEFYTRPKPGTTRSLHAEVWQ